MLTVPAGGYGRAVAHRVGATAHQVHTTKLANGPRDKRTVCLYSLQGLRVQLLPLRRAVCS